MCGIIGQVGNSVPKELPLKYLVHRGPDAQDQWSNGHNCILGHTRLSILDLNPRANQPMVDVSGRYVLVYNGEIYNYKELIESYLADEHFLTSSDTEVLLLLWRKMGVKCLALLRGMFAFAIWDNKESKLWLARDRFGQKPLVYNLQNDTITFASELNAFASCIHNLSINPDAIDLFLGYQFIPAPYTIYQNTYKLLPGHYAVWNGTDLETKQYWRYHFDESKNSAISLTEAADMLENKIRESVRFRLRADVPVGVLLSGGVDSSLITAIATQETSRKIQTFSIGFREVRDNELEYANSVAQKYATEHHTYLVSEYEAENYLLKSVGQYGEPFGDSSSLPSLMICDIASKKLKVVLNGDGGDELLAGYRAFRLSPFHRMLGSSTSFFFNAGCRLDDLRVGLPRNSFFDRRLFKLRRAISPLHRSLSSDSNITKQDRNFVYENNFLKLTNGLRRRYEQSLLDETDMNLHPLNQLLSIHCRNTFAHDFLVKMDIAGMAFGLETRSPFVDHELMELAATFPANFKMRKGIGKFLLKKMATKYLSEDILYRHKRGFGLPINEWIRTRFNSYINDMTSNSSHPLWNYLQRNIVTEWVKEHEQEYCNHGQRLWNILILGLWLNSH